jgi:hypothetical protein
LDAEFGKHLASYVDTHVALGSTLAEAKAEMDAAAKAARQKAKATQAPKPDLAIAKKAEGKTSPSTTEATPSLFSAPPPSKELSASSPGEERKTS